MTFTLAAGCASPPTGASAPMPDNFALTLWRRTTDLRHTYFKLSPDGDLAFAGGRAAIARQADRVGALSDAQRRELWRIIAESDLLTARDHPFAKPQRVQYQIEIKGDGWSRSLNLVDDDTGAAGAERLHEAIFKMHAERAYTLPGFR